MGGGRITENSPETAGGGGPGTSWGQRQFDGPKARDIANMLRPRAEELGRWLFPNATVAGGFLCIGSLHGEPGDSLKITLRGSKAGTWADYATSESDPNGKGDMLKLLQLVVGGGDMKRGIDEAKRFLQLDSMDPRVLERIRLSAAKAQARQEAGKASEDERKRRNAEGLWRSASELTPSSPAIAYLASRGIHFGEGHPLPRPPGSIRFHHAVSHAERGAKLPAMATCFVGVDGQVKGVHLTFLEYLPGKGWSKLPDMVVNGKPVKVAKKIWGPTYWGAHLPLWKGATAHTLGKCKPGLVIHASEGIEDGLSFAMAEPAARVIGGGTLGNLGQMRLPIRAGDLVMLAQNDTKPEPIQSFEDALRKQQAQAREHAVRIAAPARRVLVRRPPPGIKDWNDWLNASEGEA